jgi:peptide/nickel transport system ATP-binding protein
VSVPVLQFDRVTLSYRRHARWLPAVRDLSFSLAPGEAYAMVGESGCGKSTAALAAMRFLPRNARLDGGRIALLGRDLWALPPAELRRLHGERVAMVYQNPATALNPSLTLGAQVAEVFRHRRGLDRREAAGAAVEMLARMRIADPARVAGLYPFQVSGGMQQRAVIAMALATEPDLLVLDEPTTALDATVQAEILDLFAELRRTRSTALLFISHNLDVVRRVCDRVGILYAGELVEEGDTAQVLARPRHPYAAALAACLPRPGQRKGGRRLATLPGVPPDPAGLPRGCAFAPRCPSARPDCDTVAPFLALDDRQEGGRGSGRQRLVRCRYPLDGPDPHVSPGPAAAERPGSGEPLLSLRGVGHGIGKVDILRRIDLDIHAGETFALVGESGSGKTTLARVIAGLAAPGTGTVTLDGAPLAGHAGRRTADQRRAVQMVFQTPDTTLNPSRCVASIVGRAVRVLGGRRGRARRERVAELLGMVRLPAQTASSRPGRLSGGQRQRVAIARAFAGSPRLVILDEPTSALDASVQAAVLNLLLDLQAEGGAAYLFISHDLGVVRYVADRVAVMYLGELVEVGPTERVFSGPHHPYTTLLLSAVPGADMPPLPAGTAAPGPADRPAGCAFRGRCPHALDRCAVEEPPWRPTADGHAIRCWIAPDRLVPGRRHVLNDGAYRRR